MLPVRLCAALAALALAASVQADDVLTTTAPANTATASTTSKPATRPWSGAPPTAADFPVHDLVIDDDTVLESVRKGVDFLLAHRKGDNFESGGYAAGGASNVGGETAIIVYALLHVGESVSDEDLRKKLNFASPELAPVITYLKNVVPDGTYTAGLLACALTLMPKTPDIVAALDRPNGAKSYLIRATNDNGGYSYTVPGAALDVKVNEIEQKIADLREKLHAPGKKDPKDVLAWNAEIKTLVEEANKERTKASAAKAKLRKSFNPDGSNTQYGVLGAWALADYGMPMPPGYWLAQDKYWRNIVTPEGAFPYRAKDPRSTYSTMSAAGLATLFITQEFLDTAPRLEPRNDKQMEAAISYITDDFNPKSTNGYYQYGIERVGLASGLKFLGTHDWYRELADTIVKSQRPDGGWSPNFFTKGEGSTIATSYALLTLARGRNPVFVNKLSYSGPWNARPRDAARLTEKMAKSFERPLNWQVVSHLIAPENWIDAPILLITGSEDPNFSPELIAKLKAYTEMGGLIFSTADGEKPEFTEAMKKYAAAILPGRQMREISADHPILNGELWTKVANPPKILALSNGIREVWVHSPVDMGAAWHKKDATLKPCWDIPGNLYFYATGKTNLKSRLQSTFVRAPDSVPGPTLTLGRLMIGDNPDPEPAAWPRMARLMRVVCKTDIQVKPVTLADLNKSDPPPPPALHLTGTTKFTVSDDDIKLLQNYLANGGTLLADAAGMSPEFTSSFLQLCAKLYPNNPLGMLPAAAPIYTGGGFPNAKPIEAVRYRPYWSLKNGIPTNPRLQAIQPKRGGRYTVIFSEHDITSGLLGTNTWPINGYTPESAQALARNILLYTLNNAPPASTQPATQPASTEPATQTAKQNP